MSQISSPLKLFANIFTCDEPLSVKFVLVIAKKFLSLHQFWSICINFIIFASKTPQILTVQLSYYEIHAFFFKKTSQIK